MQTQRTDTLIASASAILPCANVRDTFTAIRALGLSVRRVDGEWRVNFKDRGEGTAYYTTDNADAIATARAMICMREKISAIKAFKVDY